MLALEFETSMNDFAELFKSKQNAAQIDTA
jgi:hypothetical protein